MLNESIDSLAVSSAPRLPKSERLKRIYVEISNICNLQCSFCPEVERPAKEISLAAFQETIEKIRPHTEEIYLHLMGEPLGHSRFGELLAICDEKGMPVKITSNGTLLNPTNMELLLKPIVKQVNISLHSFPDNFPGRSVSGYMGKIFKFLDLVTTQRPDLYINLRLWDLDQDQAGRPENEDLRFAIEQAFNVNLAKIQPDVRRRKGVVVKGRISVHFDSRFVWPALKEPLLSQKGRCQGLKSHVGIHADGTVVPCCLDKEAVLTLGNIHQKSLSEILQSERAVAMREGFARGDLVEDLCRRCQFVERFR